MLRQITFGNQLNFNHFTKNVRRKISWNHVKKSKTKSFFLCAFSRKNSFNWFASSSRTFIFFHTKVSKISNHILVINYFIGNSCPFSFHTTNFHCLTKRTKKWTKSKSSFLPKKSLKKGGWQAKDAWIFHQK